MKNRIVSVVLAALMLGACATLNPPSRPMPEYGYASYPPVELNVAAIHVNDYVSTMQPDHVEHLMPQPLPYAVGEWARTRFKAIGAQGTAYITIEEAIVTGSALDRTKGLKGLFTVDQSERYDGRIVVRMRVENAVSGNAIGGTAHDGNGTVTVERGQTVSEKASLQERDRVWTEMAEKMLGDLDAATMQMIHNRLPFVLRTQ